jgi:hypothetical protein
VRSTLCRLFANRLIDDMPIEIGGIKVQETYKGKTLCDA